MSKITHGKHIIDAAGQRPGRLATAIVKILTGKHKPTYVAYQDLGEKVLVTNAGQAVFSGRKIEQKIYRRHSMYPGGLRETPAKKVIKDDPTEPIRAAVSKMLPRNKFRANRLNRLSFSK